MSNYPHSFLDFAHEIVPKEYKAFVKPVYEISKNIYENYPKLSMPNFRKKNNYLRGPTKSNANSR